jgi:hypothetical protein
MSIHFEILVFSTSTIVISTEGMHGLNAVRGLKIVLNKIENAREILVSIVYILPLISYDHVNLASIVH